MESYVSQESVLALMAKAMDAAGGQDAYADKVGVNTRQIEHLLKGRRNPRGAVLRDLGFEVVILYRRVSP